jgi:hypothetical protein
MQLDGAGLSTTHSQISLSKYLLLHTSPTYCELQNGTSLFPGLLVTGSGGGEGTDHRPFLGGSVTG